MTPVRSSGLREVNDENDEIVARRVRSGGKFRTPDRLVGSSQVVASPRTQIRHQQKLEILHKIQRQNSYFRRELGKVGASPSCSGALEASEATLKTQKLKASIEIWQHHSEELHGERPEVESLRAEMADYKAQLDAIETLHAEQLDQMKRRCDDLERDNKSRLDRVQAAADDYRRQLDQCTADLAAVLAPGPQRSTFALFAALLWALASYLLAWNLCRHFPVDLARVAH